MMITAHALRACARRITARFCRTSHRSALLGFLLLAVSTIAVVASGNTDPDITSATVTPNILSEGQKVTLNVSFTDPDVGDAHTLIIRWRDGTEEKRQIPVGQFSFQATHTYVDNTISPANSIWLDLKDRQTPVGSEQSDNTESYGATTGFAKLYVRNLPPTFSRGITAQKSHANSRAVTVKGAFADPGTADTHEVRVSWGTEANPFTPVHPCVVNGKQFTCTHTYPNGTSGTFTIRLRVKDDDGDVDNTSLQIQLP